MVFERVREQLNMLGIPCRERVSMAPYTTFHIGGEVALLVEPTDERQLVSALRVTRESGARMLILGRGSNVLFPDEAMEAVVIRTAGMYSRVTVKENTVYAGCGIMLGELACHVQRAGLGGLEFAYGIPGTLGGALCMNAGAYGGEMCNLVTSVRLYDVEHRETVVFDCAQMQFSYRRSILLQRSNLVALSATLHLQKDDPAAIEARMRGHMQSRRDKQPLEYPSAGSVFKRPAGAFAGALIEQSGLKGCRVGGAEVSPKHAGFIVNVGGATAHDVLTLIRHIRDTVKRDSGVTLEPEIRILTSLDAK